MEVGEMGCSFLLKVGAASTPCNYVTQSNIKNADYIFEAVFIHLNFSGLAFFPFLLCISAESRTKLKKIWTHRLK